MDEIKIETCQLIFNNQVMKRSTYILNDNTEYVYIFTCLTVLVYVLLLAGTTNTQQQSKTN